MPEDTQNPTTPVVPESPAAQAVEHSNAEAQPSEQAPAAPVAEEKPLDQVFREKYQALVAETGHVLSVEPKYVKRDDGSFSTVIETSIQPVK